jgi:hypothetical protein
MANGVAEWTRDFWSYLRAVAVAYRHVPFGVTFLATALAIYNALRPKRDLAVLPPWLWVVVGAAALMVATFAVWRELSSELIEPEHAADLRTLVKRVSDQVHAGNRPNFRNAQPGAWTHDHIFESHFPDLARSLDQYVEQSGAVESGKARVLAYVRSEAPEVFPNCDGWSWGGIYERFATHFDALVAGAEPQLDPSVGDLLWDSHVVFDRRPSGPYPIATNLAVTDEQAAEEALTAEVKLRAWLAEVIDGTLVTAYRQALQRRAAAKLSALSLIDPVLTGLPLRRKRHCKICFPPKELR